MKIRFFGTSDGVPTATRKCTSLALETNGKIYAIDMGAPFVHNLLKSGKTVDDVNAVFITHTHTDHVQDLYAYASIISWYYKNSTANIYLPEIDLADAIKNYYKTCEKSDLSDRVKFTLYDENTVYQDENVKVTFIPTKHIAWMNRPSYSVMFETEGKRVLFSGDLSNNLNKDDFPKVLYDNHFDAVILELAHFEMSEVLPHLNKCNIDNLFFNHVNNRHRKEDDINEYKKTAKSNVVIVNDDDCYEI